MKIFAFDLDGTLTVSKGPIDCQMKKLLLELLRKGPVCVISGGRWQQFKDQLVDHLVDAGASSTQLDNLHCFPTSGTAYYRHSGPGDFYQVYDMALTEEEKRDILVAFDMAMAEIEYDVEDPYGEVLEDRGSQMTFSALGQEAPLEEKKEWDPFREKRRAMIAIMQPMLPDFDVRLGGTTSVDVTRKGCDKRLAISKICEYLDTNYQKLIFFGDSLEPGGNDHAVYEVGVECIPVSDHIDCIWKVRQYIRTL